MRFVNLGGSIIEEAQSAEADSHIRVRKMHEGIHEIAKSRPRPVGEIIFPALTLIRISRARRSASAKRKPQVLTRNFLHGMIINLIAHLTEQQYSYQQ